MPPLLSHNRSQEAIERIFSESIANHTENWKSKGIKLAKVDLAAHSNTNNAPRYFYYFRKSFRDGESTL